MIVRDRPIDAAEDTAALVRQVASEAHRIAAVNRLQRIRDIVGDGYRQVIQLIGEAGAERAGVHRLAAILNFFIGAEEPQAVFDDRAAQGRTPVPVLEIAAVDDVAVDGLAGQAGAVEDTEGRTMKFVRARLGDDVDVTAGELTVFHVERREFHRRLAHRIERDRQVVAVRETGVVQTKAVRIANAVDRE